MPKGKHSVFGIGSEEPDPNDKLHLTDEGIVDQDGPITVPWGTPKKSNCPKTTLNYNEYVVYNTNQVKLKYLVKLKFLYDDLI